MFSIYILCKKKKTVNIHLIGKYLLDTFFKSHSISFYFTVGFIYVYCIMHFVKQRGQMANLILNQIVIDYYSFFFRFFNINITI